MNLPTRRLAALAASITLALPVLLVAAAAPGAQAADNGTWSVYPKQNKEASARAAFVYSVAASQQVKDQVVVKNSSDQPLSLRLYPADAFNAAGGGGFGLKLESDTQTDVGTWVTLAKQNITLAPGKSEKVNFTMAVPRNATPGDHIGGIVAVNKAVEGTPDGGVTVALKRAVGSRIYARVQGPLSPAVNITNIQVEMTHQAQIPFLQTGSAQITYTAVNTGNVRINADQGLLITGLFGQVIAQPILPKAPELLPGQQMTLTQQVDGIPALNQLNVRVELQSAELTSGADATVWVIPWVTVLVVVLVVVLLLVLRWWRRRSAGATPAPRGDSADPFPSLVATAASSTQSTDAPPVRAHGRQD
jgi:hypothetical protein